MPSLGRVACPAPSGAPGYDVHAVFEGPSFNGYRPFTDAKGSPVGPYGEYMRRIDTDPLYSYSPQIMPCFGAHNLYLEGLWGNNQSAGAESVKNDGFAFCVVDSSTQPLVKVVVDSSDKYPDSSDPGLVPIPDDCPVQTVYANGGTPTAEAGGDSHAIILDINTMTEWVLYKAWKDPNSPGVWHAGVVASYDYKNGGGACRVSGPLYRTMTQVNTNSPEQHVDAVVTAGQLRRDGWPGGDAGGLPLLPFILRYDEVKAAVDAGLDQPIPHALRITAFDYSQIQWGNLAAYPATSTGLSGYNPYDHKHVVYGMRLRLNHDWWVANRVKYQPFARAILATLATYGCFIADGSSMVALCGVADSRWPYTADLAGLTNIPIAHAFEVIQPIPTHSISVSGPSTYNPATQTFSPVDVTVTANPAAVGQNINGFELYLSPDCGATVLLGFMRLPGGTVSVTPTVSVANAYASSGYLPINTRVSCSALFWEPAHITLNGWPAK